MGFLDKAKAQASQLAAKAQEGVKQGQAKLDDSQARKKAEGLLTELGAWAWAQQHGRDEGRGDAEIARITGELAAHEAEHGPITSPAQQPEPVPEAAPPAAPSMDAPPAPPAGAPAAGAPAAPPPVPAPAAPAAPPVPEGGFNLDDL